MKRRHAGARRQGTQGQDEVEMQGEGGRDSATETATRTYYGALERPLEGYGVVE
jgi:hypothetical protein